MKDKSQSPPEHAWVKGRKEMDRMFGDLAHRRIQWMTIALVSMVCSIVLAISITVLVTSDRNIPWIVEVDKLGAIRVAGEAVTVDVPDYATLAVIHRVLHNMRQIPTDRNILGAMHQSALAHMAGSARLHFAEDLEKNAKELANILGSGRSRYVAEITSTLPIPGQVGLYHIKWNETNVPGGADGEYRAYEGYFQVRKGSVPTDNFAILNPLGMYITEYSISPITTEDP